LEAYFFILGLVNSVFLILLFLVRKNRLDLIYRFGFLGIFLAFLLVEGLFDYALKINFRENWRKNWKWLVPYLGLYYAMNYGFVVMPWKTSLVWGLIMLGLFIVQIIANLRSHPKMTE
jgi:hypothetical protein